MFFNLLLKKVINIKKNKKLKCKLHVPPPLLYALIKDGIRVV